jgi:threonine dehydrogenase-like Zn-dependent dehydrogenase
VAGRIDLKSIITHVVPFEKYAECFELLKDGKAAKIVMTISE